MIELNKILLRVSVWEMMTINREQEQKDIT